MRLRIGRPRAALIVAPHADDEAIAASGLIVALRRRSTRVGILIVTDGAASHPGSVRWPPERLVAERRRECRRAMRRLGLSAAAIEYLGLPDGGLAGDPVRCERAIRRAIRRRRDIRLIVAPRIDDRHPDHRAVAGAVTAARFAGRVLRYRIWPATAAGKGAVALPAPGAGAQKRSLIRGYRTQTGAITDATAGFNMSHRELAAFARPVESFEEIRR